MPTDDLAERLAHIISQMRADARASVEAFLVSAEDQLGGTLSIQAPSANGKRRLPEAGYRSEQFVLITS